MNKIKVLMTASECYPIAKAGGLGDILNSLPKALVKKNIEVKIILPRYKFIEPKYVGKLLQKNIPATIDGKKIRFNVYKSKLAGSNIEVLFIDHKLLRTDKIYVDSRRYLKGGKYSRDIHDVERFVLFSKLINE